MQKPEITALMRSIGLHESDLVETHISWVILGTQFVYKIKKPVRFSFLDFTTLELRHKYCTEEVELNKRLTQGIYIGVVPVYKTENSITIEAGTGQVIDYAVKMHRLPSDRQMDILLGKGLVTRQDIEQIAEQLAVFHSSARVADTSPDVEVMLSDFTDLSNCTDVLISRFGSEGKVNLESAITCAREFLHAHAQRIHERHRMGFIVDGHGDLHSKNIFLLDKPVIFDCIEFSDHLRQVDVLDELAFFCLDLELLGYRQYATHFMEYYGRLHPCILTGEDKLLFHYYQLYRAGVKLKINCIKVMNASDNVDKQKRLGKVDRYYALFVKFLETLIHETSEVSS